MSEHTAGDLPIHVLGRDTVVRQWLVLGPFPNPEPAGSVGGGSYRTGFYKDYLEQLGGEASVQVGPNTELSYTGDNGNRRHVTVRRAKMNEEGVVDLSSLYTPGGDAVAYAGCVVESETDQRMYGYFGSSGSVRIWVNGELVVSFYHTLGRPFQEGDDFFTVPVKAGRNRVLVKVENNARHGWTFRLEMVDARHRKQGAEYRKFELLAFQAMDVVRTDGGGRLLTTGMVPLLRWADADLVREVVGEVPLEAFWYRVTWQNDGQHPVFDEVEHALEPGPYIAIVEGTSPDGMEIRRGFTYYCVPKEWRPQYDALHTYVDAMPILIRRKKLGFSYAPYSKEAWHEIIDTLAAPDENHPGTAEETMLLTGFERSQELDRPLTKQDEPMVVDGDLHARLRFFREGKPASFALAPPAETKVPAQILKEGTPEDAGVTSDTTEALRELCQTWSRAGDEPFANVVARNGVIFHRQGFGGATTSDPLWIASISKMLSALLFARFVDQELLDFDDPVGAYVDGFPVDGNEVLTVRHLLNHTSGLWGHVLWGGIYNPYLDNIIANGREYLHPGREHIYGGMGYDLCGRILERITGRGVVRMMYEELIDPLGLKHTNVGDFGGLTMASAEDLAVVGQMLLNGGSYGDKQYFRPETLQKMLPEELRGRYPGLPEGLTWGMGFTWMRRPHPQAGEGDLPDDATLLGKNTFGHGAASSAVFRVDPDNCIIVMQARNNGGQEFDAYLERFLEIIHNGIIR